MGESEWESGVCALFGDNVASAIYGSQLVSISSHLSAVGGRGLGFLRVSLGRGSKAKSCECFGLI